MKTMKTMAVSTKADGYEEWIRSIKERIQRARVKASMLVNSEQTLLYWDIGHDILEKQDKVLPIQRTNPLHQEVGVRDGWKIVKNGIILSWK